ncbi:MAG: hypothetical protein UY01_C0006G0034 [Candidatus Nomurabacteria bacterium GW2011_GWB1_47_6]|uniref:Uncharacterized protein n=1 Tax=Candidatus Nomurabacteria bacterium GW2011_GWB1_47_6 TaxID=1618749 RepID=A0A0G1W072_9BACT|nr:MAG: hypothetical protein UY01_C0006G0034 [Candidatus Nomurabacteria bacterium GW2011_GWB1_47_6]
MKIDIKNLFKKKRHFRKGGFHANPNIGWELTLALAFVVIAGFFVFGFSLFMATNREFNEPFSGGQSGTTSIREEKLRNALKIFSEREERSREILYSPAAVVDPSL